MRRLSLYVCVCVFASHHHQASATARSKPTPKGRDRVEIPKSPSCAPQLEHYQHKHHSLAQSTKLHSQQFRSAWTVRGCVWVIAATATAAVVVTIVVSEHRIEGTPLLHIQYKHSYSSYPICGRHRVYWVVASRSQIEPHHISNTHLCPHAVSVLVRAFACAYACRTYHI